MLSDLENLDILLGGNHLEREESEYSDSSRRQVSPSYKVPESNGENHYPNSRENRSSKGADYGHTSAGTDSSAESLALTLDYQVIST